MWDLEDRLREVSREVEKEKLNLEFDKKHETDLIKIPGYNDVVFQLEKDWWKQFLKEEV